MHSSSAPYQFVRAAANGAIFRSGHSCLVRRRCRKSPQRKSSFFAACARSAEFSASAQSSAPQRGWKLGHSNIAQLGSSEQLTDRGLTGHRCIGVKWSFCAFLVFTALGLNCPSYPLEVHGTAPKIRNGASVTDSGHASLFVIRRLEMTSNNIVAAAEMFGLS